jgi:hypothetical protein
MSEGGEKVSTKKRALEKAEKIKLKTYENIS